MSTPNPQTQPPVEASAADILAALQRLATGTSSTGTTSTAPLMGGVHSISGTNDIAWCGGLPKSDWSGLDPSAATSPTTPHQYRSTTIGTAQKAHAYRTKGLSTLLTMDSDLSVFEQKVLEHLEKYGMDSVSYVPDPLDSEKMTCCVSHHTRLSVDTATETMKTQLQNYDSYDKSNDDDATKFLYASLSDELNKDLRSTSEDSDPFPVVFLRLISIVQPRTIQRFNNIKERIKKRHPSQYAGEDLSKLAIDFRQDARELSKAGQYDHSLTLDMLKIFLLAGGKDNEAFRFNLRGIKRNLDKKLVDIAFLSPKDANTAMTKAELTPVHVCNSVAEDYRTALSTGEWPPARHNPDSKAAPANFSNLASSQVSSTQINALIQNAMRDKSQDTCNICGKKGHWANECPNKKNGGKRSMDRRTNKHKRFPHNNNHNNNNGRSRRMETWQTTPPKPGEPQTKTVPGKSKPFHWCAECHRWSTTHGTAGHTGPKREKNTHQVHSLSMDPSAWHTPFILQPTWIHLLQMIFHSCFSVDCCVCCRSSTPLPSSTGKPSCYLVTHRHHVDSHPCNTLQYLPVCCTSLDEHAESSL